MAGVKPAGAMKTPSGTFTFGIILAIVILAVVSCVTQIVPNQQVLIELGSDTTYAEWKDQPTFDKALAQVCQHGGYYDLTVLVKVGDQPIHPYKPCGPSLNIRTVKITKSKVADHAATGESAANDPNAMHKIASAYIDDGKAVLNALK